MPRVTESVHLFQLIHTFGKRLVSRGLRQIETILVREFVAKKSRVLFGNRKIILGIDQHLQDLLFAVPFKLNPLAAYAHNIRITFVLAPDIFHNCEIFEFMSSQPEGRSAAAFPVKPADPRQNLLPLVVDVIFTPVLDHSEHRIVAECALNIFVLRRDYNLSIHLESGLPLLYIRPKFLRHIAILDAPGTLFAISPILTNEQDVIPALSDESELRPMNDRPVNVPHPEKSLLHENLSPSLPLPRRLNILYPLLDCCHNFCSLILWNTRKHSFPQPKKIIILQLTNISHSLLNKLLFQE